MDYKVFNKEGCYALFHYPCFGALNRIGEWGHKNADFVNFKDKDGRDIGRTLDMRDTGKFENVTFAEGFHPSNFDYLEWSPEENPPEIWKVVKTLAETHPLFSEIVVEEDEGVIRVPLGKSRMDQTLLPLFIIRDFMEVGHMQLTFEALKEFTDNVVWRVFISTLFPTWRRYDGEEILHLSVEDGRWIDDKAKVGHVIDTILWKRPPVFADDTWEETDLGYACYGSKPSFSRPTEEGWTEEEWDAWYEEVEPRGGLLPKHPLTKEPYTIDTCCMVGDDYVGFEGKRLRDLIVNKELLEEFVTLLKKKTGGENA